MLPNTHQESAGIYPQQEVQENTKSSQKTSDALDQNVQILVEIKDTILKCVGPANGNSSG